MNGQKRVFVIDVDNTLLNTDGIKAYWIETLHTRYKISKNDFTKAYNSSKNPTGFPNITKIARSLHVEKDFFYKTPFKKYVFENALANIKRLKKIGKVIVFSLGEREYQATKIKESGIEKATRKNNIIIVQDKKQGLKNLIALIKKEGFSNINIINDVSSALVEANKIDPRIVTIWVRFGKYKNKLPLIRSAVTFETDTFAVATEYLTRLISNICLPGSNIKLSVLKDINENQAHDLITYTKKDKRIKKYTHDSQRFRSLKTFSTWKLRNKTIYSLVNKRGKLQGIIWFDKKSFRKILFTFAIRIYPPVRGKGIARKFMRLVIKDFGKTHKNRVLWLITDKNNLPANNLYQDFGFKKISETEKEIVMALKN